MCIIDRVQIVERSNAYAAKFHERSNAYAAKFHERSNAYAAKFHERSNTARFHERSFQTHHEIIGYAKNSNTVSKDFSESWRNKLSLELFSNVVNGCLNG